MDDLHKKLKREKTFINTNELVKRVFASKKYL